MKCRLHTILSLASGLSYIWHRAYKKKTVLSCPPHSIENGSSFQVFYCFQKKLFF